MLCYKSIPFLQRVRLQRWSLSKSLIFSLVPTMVQSTCWHATMTCEHRAKPLNMAHFSSHEYCRLFLPFVLTRWECSEEELITNRWNCKLQGTCRSTWKLMVLTGFYLNSKCLRKHMNIHLFSSNYTVHQILYSRKIWRGIKFGGLADWPASLPPN